MEQWAEIRRRVLVEGESKRQILRETGMHWETLKKILEHSEPPGYRQSKPRASKLDAYRPMVERILQEDRQLPKRQRHTAKRIYERLRDEGFTGSYTIVKDTVRELRQKHREVFVPAEPPRPSLRDANPLHLTAETPGPARGSRSALTQLAKPRRAKSLARWPPKFAKPDRLLALLYDAY